MGWRDEEEEEDSEEAAAAPVGVAETDFVEILSMVIDLKKVNLVGVECKEEDFKVLGYGELGW